MSVTKRLSALSPICLAILALSAPIADVAHAQTVETYVNQAVPTATGEGVIPDGMTWNRPLKAGEMVLPRLSKSKANSQYSSTHSPSGDLKAPLIGQTTTAQAPQLSTETGSTQSIMLLQGMKSALKQSGQNPDIPKSESVAMSPEEADKPISSAQTLPSFGKPVDIKTAPQAQEGVSYVKGQEPKSWGTPDGRKADDGMSDIVFPPEMTASGSSATDPKATELQEQPLPLEAANTTPAQKEEPGFFDRLTKPFSSIFGEPIDEAKEKANKAAAQSQQAAPSNTLAGACQPTVSEWTMDCVEAGYPAHFVGSIAGEKRTECPSGDVKNVWLSNSCAAPIGSSSFAVQSTASAPDATTTNSISQAAQNIIVSEGTEPVDGACGTSNGLASEAKPAGDLCAQGQATAVLGEGPWRWNCQGLRGGMMVSCAAPVAQISAAKAASGKTGNSINPAPEALVLDGKCGSAVNAGAETAPAAELCAQGTPSRVNGNGPWTWACSGSNGGTAAACTTNRKTDGVCGAANDTGMASMPMSDLCSAGYASAVTGVGPWYWTCSGLHGGNPATCSASTKVNGICGSASMKGHNSTPNDNLCSSGNPSEVQGQGPWNWNCQGAYNGATVPCTAPVKKDGICGPAHGNQFAKAPDSGLCNEGSPSRVTGLGPWNWNCTGIDGGSTASCTAALGSAETAANAASCGEAAESLPISKPESNLCRTGKASDVEGDGPWSWTCSDDVGHKTNCMTISASDGECGEAVSVATAQKPEVKLCSKGTPTEVAAVEGKTWRWECQGIMNGRTAECSTPISKGPDVALQTMTTPNEPVRAQAKNVAECGASNGQGFTHEPDEGLCASGKASAVKGSGPWKWTCSLGKTKAACEALKTVEGSCGTANGSVLRTQPTSGLCTSGSATEVTGNGPWMWSCIGIGGGSSTSCSASAQSQTKVDGTCGSAADNISTYAPTSNLCDSGMPSPVHGDGPWTWTCSGMNGGVASTCSTSRVMPAAPPPPGPPVNGVCGFANGMVALSAPDEGLCSSGTASALSGNGPWNWSCLGGNGGMTVSCTAPLMPPAPVVGACGNANGLPTLTPPKSSLCSSGIASAVSGKGPWTWSCSGTNGGGAVSCVAPLAGASGSQPLPSMTTPSAPVYTPSPTADEVPAPRAAPVGLVTPQLPTGTLPAMKPGTVPVLKTSKVEGAKTEPAKASKGKETSKADEPAQAPDTTPELPEGMEALPAPPIREEGKPTEGLKPPVLDSAGKPVPGAKIQLEADLSSISFTRGSDQLDKDAVEIVEKLANVLKSNPSSRITLVAYADTAGEVTPRDARRLSLNRALAIRDFLTNKGVPSGRVDVRPMGANVPSGDMDRVDVKVN